MIVSVERFRMKYILKAKLPMFGNSMIRFQNKKEKYHHFRFLCRFFKTNLYTIFHRFRAIWCSNFSKNVKIARHIDFK